MEIEGWNGRGFKVLMTTLEERNNVLRGFSAPEVADRPSLWRAPSHRRDGSGSTRGEGGVSVRAEPAALRAIARKQLRLRRAEAAAAAASPPAAALRSAAGARRSAAGSRAGTAEPRGARVPMRLRHPLHRRRTKPVETPLQRADAPLARGDARLRHRRLGARCGGHVEFRASWMGYRRGY